MSLQTLNRSTVDCPELPQTKMIVFGGGNFVRAFILYFLNEYNKNASNPFGATVVKVTPGDYQDWKSQDGLYHILTKGIQDGTEIEKTDLICAVTNILSAYEQWEELLEMAKDPSIHFLVNNVTESGLKFSEESYTTDIPKEFPAKLTQWLFTRYKHFKGDKTKGCMIMPCELIENNASLLKAFILRYIEHWQLPIEFKDWVEQCCSFCNTLVDRIVPGVNKNHLLAAQEKVGYQDQLITEAEPYHIFVIEANEEVATTLPWHQTAGLNIIYTPDLSDYRIRKIRILNGAHSSMVPVGLIAGLEIVKNVMDNDIMAKYVDHLIYKEIIPCLPLPESDLFQYATETLDRFKNPFLYHKLETISLNSFSKARVRIIPTMKEYQGKTGELPEGTLLAFACLILLYKGKFNSILFVLKDDTYVLDTMKKFWNGIEDSKLPQDESFTELLRDKKLWGEDLTRIRELQLNLIEQMKRLHQNGVMHEIASILSKNR